MHHGEKVNKVRLSKSCISEEEVNEVVRVLRSEFLGMGQEVMLFESELSQYFERETLCVVNGTSALQLALQGVGVGIGDEVIVPSLTYIASFQAISALGAVPIAVDVMEKNLLLDVGAVEKLITRKTKVIMPVHYSGDPSGVDRVYKLASKYSLRVIEDAAHAFGSKYNNRKVGSFGDIACFSFDGIKNITSGEGGCIVSDDLDLIRRIKDIRLLGVCRDSDMRYQNKRSWHFDVVSQGWRYHMSNIMAAIGRVQLRNLDVKVEKRRLLALLYDERLKTLDAIKIFKRDYSEIAPHIYVVRVINDLRDGLLEALNNEGIETGIHYRPNHLHTYYKSNIIADLTITNKVYKEILTLPLHPDMDESDIDRICTKISKYLKKRV